MSETDPVARFEALYRAQRDGTAEVPWDRGAPNAMLVAWAADHHGSRRAMVVGCGPGRDAEFVAAFAVGGARLDRAVETDGRWEAEYRRRP